MSGNNLPFTNVHLRNTFCHMGFWKSAAPFFVLFLLIPSLQAAAQTSAPKMLPARRTTATFKIDGNLEEAAWKEAVPATQFVEWRPAFGRVEDSTNRTVVYILYDNTSVYVGGYCYERTRDSVAKELVGRDQVGVNDFIGVIFDTYQDKINASGFYVTPLGEQFDAKYSNSPDNSEDGSWNAVWDSESKIVADGWTFEMRIPYSALRFSNAAEQTWGLNITRRRQKTGQQYMWNQVDPKVNGFINQEGLWTGLQNIESPVRLQLSPYFSTYVNHYPHTAGRQWTSSVAGGLDVKYGISPAFTLDMTLVPDFGQVQSDNQVLNLTPFEIQYNENRPFFTEGIELFSKGNLFYSRRVGGTPLHYYDVAGSLQEGETILKNPAESKLINATKISGRTKGGLGIGFFNAITKPMYADVEDASKNKHRVETGPLTNYNIIVLDQTLKNNSAISFINTNVLRSGADYDANVSAALFNINNKKNTYNWSGKFSLSHLTNPASKASNGYAHNIGFGKTGGRWNFQLVQDVADEKYDINDMGILFNNNFIDHSFWTGYRWLKPKGIYNRIQVNFNAYYSQLFNNVPQQKIRSRFQTFNTNVNANVQLKSLWWFGFFIGNRTAGNDFYEPRVSGFSFRTSQRTEYNVWVETNEAKKYYAEADVEIGRRKLFAGRDAEIEVSHRYRFNDKFSLTQDLSFSPSRAEAGFYDLYYEGSNGNAVLKDVILSRRARNTVENIIRAKYNFNNRSGITFRARHYWSKVEPQQLFDLQQNGTLLPTTHTGLQIRNQNFNFFNIDAVYTLQFAPGSFLNVVWKNAIFTSDDAVKHAYFKNFGETMEAPQNNNVSIKILWYIDYLDLKKWRSKKKGL